MAAREVAWRHHCQPQTPILPESIEQTFPDSECKSESQASQNSLIDYTFAQPIERHNLSLLDHRPIHYELNDDTLLE